MKKLKLNPIEIEPETISELSEEQAEEIEGGNNNSCQRRTCGTNNTQEA